MKNLLIHFVIACIMSCILIIPIGLLAVAIQGYQLQQLITQVECIQLNELTIRYPLTDWSSISNQLECD
jgi:hypothetical protein